MSEIRSEKTATRWKAKLFGVLLILACFGAAGYVGWRFIEEPLSRESAYLLYPERVRVPPAPDWVPTDFVARVLQSAGLDSTTSILDSNLPQKLAQAFAADPWVEEVLRVEIRFPSGADVQLSYRSPVALVEVPPQGFFPVDRNGVLLPTEYFINAAPEKKDDFPRIQGIRSTPFGTVGTLWGDPSVHDAAGVADLVAADLRDLEIAAIVPTSVPSANESRIVCRLKTFEGTEVVWGRFEPGDPKAEAKIRRLRELVDIYKSLDNVPSHFRPIDLSNE